MSNETIKFIRIFLVVLLAVPSLLIRWAILSRNPPSYIIGWWVVGLGGWQGFIFSAMFVDPNEMIQRGIDTNDMPGAVLMFAVISMFMILINFTH